MGQQPSRIRRSNGSCSNTTQTQTLKHGPNIQTQTLVDHPYDIPDTTNNDNFDYGSWPLPLTPGPPPYTRSSANITSNSTIGGIPPPPTAHGCAIPAAGRDEDGGKTKERPKKRIRAKDPLHPFLQQYEVVFVVDDSTSMLCERWNEAEEVLAGVAQRCALHGPEENNGIGLYFLNHRSRSRSATEITTSTGAGNAQEEEEEGYEVLDRPAADGGEGGEGGGYANLKTAEERIAQILDLYVRRVEDMMIAKLSAGRGVYNYANPHHHYYMNEEDKRKNEVKPLYLIAITDGAFTDDAEKVLVEAARRLEGGRAAAGQVRVQFFQLGNDERARKFLQGLEGGLAKVLARTIVVDMELGRGRLSADRILKSVMRAERKHRQNGK